MSFTPCSFAVPIPGGDRRRALHVREREEEAAARAHCRRLGARPEAGELFAVRVAARVRIAFGKWSGSETRMDVER
jgi:hypothetical protein